MMNYLKALSFTQCCFMFSCFFFSPRVTAFAPQDHTKELVTLRKPTVHKVTMGTVRVTAQIGSALHNQGIFGCQTMMTQSAFCICNCKTHLKWILSLDWKVHPTQMLKSQELGKIESFLAKKNKRLTDLSPIFQSVPKVQAPTALARQVNKSEMANVKTNKQTKARCSWLAIWLK